MLTELELQWLNSRGGRSEEDVRVDSGMRKYVIMQGMNNEAIRVFIPSESEIISQLFEYGE